MPLAGGTMTGNTIHNDDVKSIYGTGNDFQIYYTGTNAYIKKVDGAAGSLFIDATDLYLRSDENETFIYCNMNEQVELMYNGSKKFETTTGGVSITGSLTTTDNINSGAHVYVTDGNKFIAGSGEDLQIYHDGSNSYIEEKGTGDLIIKSFANMFLKANFGGVNDETFISNTGNGGVALFYNGVQKAETTSTGISVTGNIVGSGDFRIADNKQLQLGANPDLILFHRSELQQQ